MSEIERVLVKATQEQILGEYYLILEKKSNLSRSERIAVERKALMILDILEKQEKKKQDEGSVLQEDRN
jgi:hypothetical protein